MGGQLISSFTTAAKKYPKIKFAIIGSYPGNYQNLGSLTYQLNNYFLAGVVAGLKSKSRKVGALIGEQLAQNEEEWKAFSAGVHKANPNIQCYGLYINSWNNKKKALQFAQILKNHRIDIMFINCGYAGLDLYKWAAMNKIYTIGSIDDQYQRAPGYVLTSVKVNYDSILQNAIDLMLRGQWQGGLYRFGMTEKVTDLAILRGVLNSKQEEFFNSIYREVASKKGDVFEIK